jgi:RNA polymerase sigma factor (sigma-70 family)
MKIDRMQTILPELKKLVSRQDNETADRELLRRFSGERDEAAFAEIVRRHGPMLLRVCRRVLHSADDAEDVCQAAFLLLAQKATSLRWHESVAGWLFQAAYRLSLKARATAGRRKRHEARVKPLAPNDPIAELSLRELATVLDEELSRLPERYRAAIILCCLEGKSRDEAAHYLGWKLTVVKDRLEQGRERLRERLERRGMLLGTALTSLWLLDGAAQAGCAKLLPSATATAALSVASGEATLAGLLPVRIAALAKGAATTIWSGKATMAWLVSLVLAIGTAALVIKLTAGSQPIDHTPSQKAATPSDKVVVVEPEPGKATTAMLIKLGHATTGREGTPTAGPVMTLGSEPGKPMAMLNHALRVAEEVKDAVAKVHCLVRIAKAQHLAGDDTASRATLQQTARFVDAMPLVDVKKVGDRFQCLHLLSTCQAEVGDFDVANKTAATIQDPKVPGVREQEATKHRMWALADIAIRQARAGKLGDALKTTAVTDEWKGYALAHIATELAEAKNWEDAVAIAGMVEDNRQRCRTFTEIARLQARSGNRAEARKILEAALRVVDKIPAHHKGIKVDTLYQIARVQAEMGDAEEALQTAELFPADRTSEKEVAGKRQVILIHVKLQAGDWQGAAEIADRLPRGRFPSTDYALLLITNAQLQAGDYKGAVETFEGIADDTARRPRLAGMHAQAGDKKAASELLRQAAREADAFAYVPSIEPLLSYRIAFMWTEIGEQKAAQEWLDKQFNFHRRIYGLLGVVDAIAQREGRQRVFEAEPCLP